MLQANCWRIYVEIPYTSHQEAELATLRARQDRLRLAEALLSFSVSVFRFIRRQIRCIGEIMEEFAG